ncbi:MAG: diguanylate cyclase domain-containing protein [Sphingomonadaceae bacterium]
MPPHHPLSLNPVLPDTPHSGAARPARLLLVDDQPLNVRLLHQIFCDDHEVFMASSGEQALTLCRSLQPDLVLLDVQMPGMDGLTVCRKLSEDPATSHIPVIFVTGADHPAGETECWAAGCVDFVNKPINATTLRNRVRAHLLLKQQADSLRALAFVDGLTGVANRRQFDQRLQAAWDSCARQMLPCALLMVDIDYFKSYNDRYGHQQGDECLRRVARTLDSLLQRPDDLLARYGGEEFVALLPGTSVEGAGKVAAALEQAVRRLALPHASSAADIVTVSIGVATLRPGAGSDSEKLLREADAQLYRAKQEGRGCWRAAEGMLVKN